MFGSAILDVFVGLSFVFLMVSLATSAVSEAISGILKWRSATLLRGIKELVNDPQLTGLAGQLYQHALINPRNPGTTATAYDLSDPALAPLWHMVRPTSSRPPDLSDHAPAYIDPKHFANALIDILGAPMLSGDVAAIGAAIDSAVPPATNPQINGLLKGMAQRANGSLIAMKEEIAAWFDNAMDRVSGVYKRWSQITNFVIAFLLAVFMNISAIHVATVLWQRPLDASTMESITKITTGKLPADKEAASKQLKAALELPGQLAQPIGWAHYKLAEVDRTEPLELVAGWLITAFAALFGAPFWFDLLQLFVRLKSSGPSPKEKEERKGAAA